MTYYGTRLSEHISRREPEGYLICSHVPVARTGTQYYLPAELDLPAGAETRRDPDGVPVYRPPEEVFDPLCMASFEGMPVTDDHPDGEDGVTVNNIRRLQRGHAQNVRRGTGDESDLLLADLVITDPDTIRRILEGKREISCGYNYILRDEGGRLTQRNIRGNHIAIVNEGRAGPRVSIRDRAAKAFFFSPKSERPDEKGGKNMNRIRESRDAMLRRMLGAFARDAEADPAEVAAAASLISALENELPAPDEEPSPMPAEEPADKSGDACRPEDCRDDEPAAAGIPSANQEELVAGLSRLTETLSELARLIGILTARAADEETESPADLTEDPAAEAVRLAEAALAEAMPAEEEPAGETDPEALLSDEEEESAAAAGDPAVSEAIRALMPVVAAIPEENRKEAADALLRAARKNAGLAPRASGSPYAAMRARKASDRGSDPEDLGRRIMATRNVNMRRRA